MPAEPGLNMPRSRNAPVLRRPPEFARSISARYAGDTARQALRALARLAA